VSPPVEVVVKRIGPVTVAFNGVTGGYDRIPDAFGKLYDWIGRKGYKPRGPAIMVYHTVPGEVSDAEARWEVRSALSGDIAESAPDSEGLGVKPLGESLAATVMHKGPYERLEQTYEALLGWIAENGYEITGPLEELYYNEPAETPTEELLTELRLAARKRQGTEHPR
jgi:effector-binding domain-containing protein